MHSSTPCHSLTIKQTQRYYPTGALGIGMQIMSVFGGEHVEGALQELLVLPTYMKVAFAVRLGYPEATTFTPVRVRRDLDDFAHRNRFGARLR